MRHAEHVAILSKALVGYPAHAAILRSMCWSSFVYGTRAVRGVTSISVCEL